MAKSHSGDDEDLIIEDAEDDDEEDIDDDDDDWYKVTLPEKIGILRTIKNILKRPLQTG